MSFNLLVYNYENRAHNDIFTVFNTNNGNIILRFPKIRTKLITRHMSHIDTNKKYIIILSSRIDNG